MGSTNQQLQQAYEAIKAGRRQEGINILLPVLKADSDNANAWWLMANALREPDDIREALENVLRLRPNHDKAQQMLDKLNARYPRKPKPPADAYDFDADDPFADDEYDPYYQPRPRAASGYPVTVVKSQKSGSSTLLVVLAIVGAIALVACGACVLLPTLSVALFAQQFGDSSSAALGDYINRGAVRRGQTVQGTVDTFDDDGWVFNADGGEQLTIEVTARDNKLDPQLYIYRPDGTLLAENDDIDLMDNTNSRVQVTLPTGGAYVIVVSAFGLGGPYDLTVR